MKTWKLFSPRRSGLAKLGLGAIALTLAAAGLGAAAGAKLVMNGSVVSTDVRTIDGQAYVRLAEQVLCFAHDVSSVVRS